MSERERERERESERRRRRRRRRRERLTEKHLCGRNIVRKRNKRQR